VPIDPNTSGYLTIAQQDIRVKKHRFRKDRNSRNRTASMRLLRYFAEFLSAVANRIVLQEQANESDQITRARQFIESNFQSRLRLALVAREVSMSPGYFCKAFKRATGVRFSNYVSRIRVEAAKRLLLDRRRKMIDIGYDAGFYSLTHFNRMFRRIAGCSPSDFQRGLQPLKPADMALRSRAKGGARLIKFEDLDPHTRTDDTAPFSTMLAIAEETCPRSVARIAN
jgi:AraC-like DNA-binding protein